MKSTLRKLVFTKQPTDIAAGRRSNALCVTVLDENGHHDPDFEGPISVVMEDAPLSSDETKTRPPNATPKRLRATAPGCEDGLSNVFYVLAR
jgi:hypothetical protein